MLIDSHCHLDMKDFNKDRIEVLERAKREGIGYIIAIGIDVKSSEAALALARKYDQIFATVGCHPHDADGCRTEDLQKLAALALEPEVVAWGEIGLDYYRNYSEKENQKKIFKEQLALAHRKSPRSGLCLTAAARTAWVATAPAPSRTSFQSSASMVSKRLRISRAKRLAVSEVRA